MKTSENRKGRALIYARFSPRRDAEECKSCEWQCAECEQFAANHHHAPPRLTQTAQN